MIVTTLGTALALGRPNFIASMFAVAALALFFAREPAIFALGYRGEDVRREEGWRARNMVRICLIVAVLAIVIGFLLADPRVKLSFGGPFVLWTLFGIITVRHEDTTFNGELIGAAAISGAGLPIAIAENVNVRIALDVWVAWILGFFAATVAMRSIVDKSGMRTRAYAWLGGISGLGLVLWLIIRLSAGFVPALPLIATAWVVAILRPKKTQRRTAEIALSVAAFVTGGILIFLTRAPG